VVQGSAAGPETARWAGPDLLTPRLRERAAEAGLAVCERLRGRELAQLGPGLASGWSGLAVLFEHADRCRPDQGWAEAARGALGRAARIAAADPRRVPPGLAAGWAGVAFASAYLGRGGQRYQGWRRELGPHLEHAAQAAAVTVRDRRDGWPFADFDHISGLAGMVAGIAPADSPEALGLVIDALAEGTVRESGQPPWSTGPEQVLKTAFGARYPDGLLNLSMAHGLAGVVAALAVASGEVAGAVEEVGASGSDAGRCHGRDGVVAALVVAAGALASAVWTDDGLVTLPHVLPLGDGIGRREGPGRTAWCYGPAGAARALGMAGSVLDSPAYARLAVELLVGSLAQPAHVGQLGTPSFCHGVAGVLQIAARMAAVTSDPRVAALVPQLCKRLLDGFDADSLLGFRTLGPRGDREDAAGLLDGAAGVGLVLLSLAHRTEPGWDRAFLLSA
jgi:lantibiotic biosynthesis protein